jgi:hypothetical protein
MKRDTLARPAPASPASTRPARLRDAAVVLPLLGLFAWMPPLIGLFSAPLHVFGVPLIVAWMFGVWLALILLALWFSRKLAADDMPDPDGDEPYVAHPRDASAEEP